MRWKKTLVAIGFAGAAALVFGRNLAGVWEFTIDDAFIIFRYAENLLKGAGIAFNPGGPPTEGVTPVLWLFLVAGGRGLWIDPRLFVKVLGTLSGFGLVLFVLLAGRPAGRTRPPGPGWGVGAAALVLAAWAPLAVHSVSGLETSLAALLVFALFLESAREAGPRFGRFGLLGLLLSMLRPEGAILVLLLGGAGLRRAGRGALRNFSLSFLLPGAVYFTARAFYFGLLLPLPILIKVFGGGASAPGERGWAQLSSLLLGPGLFWLPLTIAGLLLAVPPGRKGAGLREGACALLVMLALMAAPRHIMGYEWRFFFPFLPPLLLLSGLGAEALCARMRLPAACAALLLGPALWFGLRSAPETLAAWRGYARGLRRAHLALGTELRNLASPLRRTGDSSGAEPRPSPLLAIGDAGAVPWRSGWRSLDSFGLNDPRIALSGRHDPESILDEDPDVLVLLSGDHGAFVPLLPWEGPLEAAARTAGYRTAHKLAFADRYHLFVLARPDSPFLGRLRAWRPPLPESGSALLGGKEAGSFAERIPSDPEARAIPGERSFPEGLRIHGLRLSRRTVFFDLSLDRPQRSDLLIALRAGGDTKGRRLDFRTWHDLRRLPPSSTLRCWRRLPEESSGELRLGLYDLRRGTFLRDARGRRFLRLQRP